MPRQGEVRTRDARVALGSSYSSATYIDLLVLDREGRTPVACRVTLVEIESGSRIHRVFACPRCFAAARLLLARAGRLLCRRCARTRTRRQLERTRADWRRLGGAKEDAILRLLASVDASIEKRTRAAILVEELLAADASALSRLQAQTRSVQELYVAENEARSRVVAQAQVTGEDPSQGAWPWPCP